MASNYTEASIKTLSSLEHIRLRPGMYIGRLGNGTHAEDGIYVLLKETIDNCIDEFTMGFGKKIEVELNERTVRVRDYGRGIPLGKLIDCVSIINTGAKYDSETFQKSVGLNGVGQKAVNALALEYRAQAFRDGQTKAVEFSQGKLRKDHKVGKSEERNGTLVEFVPDEALFGKDFKFRAEFIEDMLWNYAFLNRGLSLTFNGKVFKSEHGLRDLLQKNLSGAPLYPIVHLEGEDIEVAFTHGGHYGEEYFSFVNGQHTTMGGTHLSAFREALCDTIRNFFKKDYDSADIRQSIDAAVAVRVMEPIFESQTKTKLGSTNIGPDGPSLKDFVGKFMQQSLDGMSPRRPRMRCAPGSTRANASARNWPASATWRASAPRRLRSTTRSFATAGCTLGTATSGPSRARCSSSRATRPPARSPPRATCRPRPSLR